jgi:uncharacterized protein YqgC (DUF456 family)
MSFTDVYPTTVSEFIIDLLPYFGVIIGSWIGAVIGQWIVHKSAEPRQFTLNQRIVILTLMTIISMLAFSLLYVWIHPDRSYPTAVEFFVAILWVWILYLLTIG